MLLAICVPLLYKKSVDSLDLELKSSGLLFLPLALILAYGAARIGAQLFGEIKDALFAKVEQRAIRKVALSAFRHLHRLGLRFHLDRKTGALSHIIERGTNGIETLLRFMIINILPTLLEIVLVSLVLWVMYDSRLAIITVITLLAYISFTLLMTEWRTNFVRQMNVNSSQANTKALDSLLNYETVKYFGNEEHEERRYDQSLEQYETAAVKTKMSLSYLNIGQGIIVSLGLIGVMMIAALGVMNKTLTLGDFVLVNTYLIQLYLPLNVLGFAYREIKMALVNMEQMFSLLYEPQEIQDKPQASQLQVTRGEVIFDHVMFGYDANRKILDNVSFTITAGHTVAVVGPSGAGKSTLSRLLFRFYDVREGRIVIDGQDIRDVTQQSLRAAIGMVPQDTVLFNDTIYYNIAYGHPAAIEKEVIQAAKLARIHDFVMSLPEGYKTMVGERGLKLSGGEKQRVAIARTLLKNPKLFIFDEATSALDTTTEKAIQKSLREVSENRSTLMIAHRLSTIIEADEILVLDQGKIRERGTHQQLLLLKGVYAQMWHQQLEEKNSHT
ncbi:putative multidrug export ATP-binding/permease protein [Caedimonas varicaedens]|uniref:Putative multidrug export ATP-binding/permease protein n=1 Tax=Caedimonas varicaedens TaxID=1629334 RepID=A0A0K8MFD6_9PROT|nr:putative multidrug export ATP-binding/permease protein [Caedimonas varicaedens]